MMLIYHILDLKQISTNIRYIEILYTLYLVNLFVRLKYILMFCNITPLQIKAADWVYLDSFYIILMDKYICIEINWS